MGVRSKSHRKPHFIAISGIIARYHCSPEYYVHGQDIFKTLFQSPNHERERILERTNDGRVIAMAAGVKFGRKPHSKSVIALQFIHQKMTAEAVMNKTGISRATYYRLKKVALNPF